MLSTLRLFRAAVFLAMIVLLGKNTNAQEPADIDLVKLPKDIEIQTHGPVHEAFALPLDQKPEPSAPVPKQPPAAIPELPPEERPAGDNVQWVGGYWAWDAERNDFIWVSGAYRNTPPGRQFIPGHWVNTPEGWRWVPGFWAPENQNEVPYAPEPPAPLETGPSLPPPDDDSTYIPGYWFYRDSYFAWRPGYYAPFRVGRIWIAPRYLWTPAGYIFCDGYWDYPLEDRGLLFAPVWFSRALWLDPGWYYRPRHFVGHRGLLDSLFFCGGSFYFGNYYGPAYARRGYQPWFQGPPDPLYNYYRWQNRGNPGWAAGLQRAHADRVDGRLAAPPRTFAQQNVAPNKGPGMVMPLNLAAKNNVSLVKVSAAQSEVQKANLRQSRELAQVRNKLESTQTFRAGESKSLKLSSQGKASGTPQSLPSGFPNKKTGPAPRTNIKSPNSPRVSTESAAPKTTTPGPAPKLSPAPRVNSDTPATPKFTTPEPGPKFSPAPKVNSTPAPRTFTPPAPAAPNFTPSAPGRKFSPAPKVNSAPAPRTFSAPRPAPRLSPAPSHGRSAPPAFKGGGSKGGGKRR